MNLNDLLLKHDIDPHSVLVFRHRPHEPGLRKVLPWLAADRPEVFNAYQQTQDEIVERAMKRAKYVASFIGHRPGRAVFVGVYRVNGSKRLTYEGYWRVPAYQEMKRFGMRGFTGEKRASLLWFDLALVDFYADWKGRLIVEWPGLERSWWRWSARNDIRVVAIPEDSLLDRAMPEWDELVLNWEQLSVLPVRWQSALSEWRAIYCIFDASDGKSYVGSAYGDGNLLRRWLNYAETGHGGNHLLRLRDPRYFQFSILQRVSPDMDTDAVIRLEETWKARLHTRHPHGLNATGLAAS